MAATGNYHFTNKDILLIKTTQTFLEYFAQKCSKKCDKIRKYFS